MSTNLIKKDMLLPEIEAFLEKYGFTVVSSFGDTFDIQQYTPAGEDWNITVSLPKGSTVETFINEIEEFYENFDVSEEVGLWIESAGKNGVPDARGLVEDNEWKDALLKKMSEDSSLKKISDVSAYTFNLADVLPQRSFTLDESSLETGTENGKSYAEYLIECWVDDENYRDFYDDIYERADMSKIVDEPCGTFDELKKIGGYEDSYMDVYVKVYEGGTAALSVILRDNAGLEYYRDVILDRVTEGKALYNIVKNCIGANKLEELFAESREYAIEDANEYAKEIQSFREGNFYDDADVIRTYMEYAPLQEIINFTDKPNVTMSNYKQAVNNVIAVTGVTTLRNYADKYIESLYQDNIKGSKYLDNLDTPAKDNSRKEKIMDDRITVSFEELYKHYNGNPDTEDTVKTKYGEIAHTIDDNTDYYDFWVNGNTVCMDGENVRISNVKKDCITLVNEDGEKDTSFKMTKEELMVCSFSQEVEKLIEKQKSAKEITDG